MLADFSERPLDADSRGWSSNTENAAGLQDKLTAAAQVWNAKELRHGAKLVVGSQPIKRHQAQWSHPKKWTCEGVVPLAFRLVITKLSDRGRETRREMDVVSVVALSHTFKVHNHIADFKRTLSMEACKPSWMIIQRHWDETLVEAMFTSLRDLVAPFASYWWPASKRTRKKKPTASVWEASTTTSAGNPVATWCKLSYEEYKERNAGREPRRGTLEMMGHRANLIWSQPSAADPSV